MSFSTLLPAASDLLATVKQWVGLKTLIPAYLLLVYVLRHRRLKQTLKRYHYPTRDSLAKMTDHEAYKIKSIFMQLEFPFTSLKAGQFSLFRTYGIPSISRLLVKTAEFSQRETATKRYADTSVLISEFVSNPPTSPRSHESIARMNYLHGIYRQAGKISNDDLLFTLSLFILQPIRWIERYEWRELCDLEKCALATFWKSVGDSMQISYDPLPSSQTGFKHGLQFLEELEDWANAYEAENMVPHEDNKKTADQTVAVMLWNIPTLFKQFARNGLYFLMDDRLRIAMMYPEPGPVYKAIFSTIFTLRKLMLRHLHLPRPEFLRVLRVSPGPNENPPHYVVGYEGAPYYVEPTFWNRWGPGALIVRLRGLPVPGTDGYYPEGFIPADVGPDKWVGKGKDHFEREKERIQKERRGQCPFPAF